MTANGCGPHDRWRKGCPGCQRQDNAYTRRRRAAIAAGTWQGRVPIEQVRGHIATLRASGMTLAAIARASGVPVTTLKAPRQRKYMQGPTAALVLRVHPTGECYPAGTVAATGTVRRIQALAWLGWGLTEQGRRIDMAVEQVWQLAHGRRTYVTVAVEQKFQGLFERLSATQGPSERVRRGAVRSGWLPPLAWDDIDDPLAIPNLGSLIAETVDEVAVARAARGERVKLTPAETTEVLRSRVAAGEPLTAVTKRLGINYDGAKTLLAGGLTPALAKQARIDAALTDGGDRSDRQIAADLGVQHGTVARARQRLTQQQYQLAS